jgi:small subunit ribosomal protein S6
VTHQYELMVILDPEIDERTVAPSLDKFLNVIRNDGGTIDSVDIWGRRRLAYEINKKTEGIYAVVQLTANASATVELDRQLKLSEAVMRTKVLRAEEAIAQVAEAAKLAEEKAARKAAAPAKPSTSSAPSAAPAAAVAASAPASEAPVVEAEAPAEEATPAKAKAAPKAKVEAEVPADAEADA